MLRCVMPLVVLTPLIAAPAWGASLPRLPVLPNAEAWRRLPGAGEVEQPLPVWARMLAGPLPKTTTRMLELDAMHRSGDRLDARLRCLARWAAADANGCAYGKAAAAADLKRARNAGADLATLVNHPDQLPELERAAVAFARRMMSEAHAVTDTEVKRLIELAGEERVVALVTLLAHASFQDRVFLALNVPSESAGGVPPLAAPFAHVSAKPAGGPAKPPTLPPIELITNAAPEWLRLQQSLDRQRERPGRIRVPSRAEVLERIGENHPSAWQASIRWSRVCYGFQPELTEAWFDCANAFRQESSLGNVYGNSIFWVVTQSLNCFY